VLPVEINLQTCWVTKQEDMSATEYIEAMMDQIDGARESRLETLREIVKDKVRVARAYNKRVKAKSFELGELVWKMILPMGTRDRKFGKWSLASKSPIFPLRDYGSLSLGFFTSFGREHKGHLN
jgi:hypothetical protein